MNKQYKELISRRFRLWLKFIKFLLPYWKKEFILLSLIFGGVILGLINPYLTKLVIDNAFGNKDLKFFIHLLLFGGGIFALKGLAATLKNYWEQRIRLRVNFDLNRKVFRHLQNLSFDYFQDRSTGEHLYRISSDIEKAADFIIMIPAQAVTFFPALLFTLAVVAYLNWRIALFSGIALFLYLPAYYFMQKMVKFCREIIQRSQDIFKVLNEVFSHILLVKAFGRENKETRDYLKKLIANIRIKKRNLVLETVSNNAIYVLSKIIMGLIVFYGGYQIVKGDASLGSLAAIMVYLNQLIGMQMNFINFFQRMRLGLVYCERIEDILNIKPGIVEAKNAKNITFKEGRIAFKDLSFGYKRELILSKLSFEITEGSSVALAGLSGCGKTTLLNLIIRLYDPWEGGVFIDGYNINDLKFRSLKEQIGIALQEPFLWNDNIRNNIRYGKPQATEEEIRRIAEVCLVDVFVKDLPDKYDTVIGENACKLSEGQKQKIAIARALIKKPKILILDEAMSSMDSVSEEAIVKNIKKTQSGLTLISVSHRFSTNANADLVYFLKKGSEIIIDTPKRLIEKDEVFYNLFAAQICRANMPVK